MINAQQMIVASLTTCGEDVSDAENLLAQFEEAQGSRP
jgi:hypothetical protein